MEERTQKLLNSIIKEHIKTAEPVGSKLLADKYKLGVSSATVRNEMAELESEGYIYQPHTSAGRVPTEKAYKLYVDNFLAVRDLKESDRNVLEEIVKKMKDDRQQLIKELAKSVAEISGQLVFIGFAPGDSYYTGISNIFSQPEFTQSNIVYDISLVVDHLDEVMAELFAHQLDEAKILIGSQNPFGNMCSTLVTEYKVNKKNQGIIGLLGPMRMDYDSNLGLINYTRELINSI